MALHVVPDFFLEDLVISGVNTTETKFYTESGEEHDRTQALSASELGSCIRKTAYRKKGGKKNEKPGNWGFAQRGVAGEAWAVEKIRAGLKAEGKGGKLLFAGSEQVSLQHDNISGTPDGIIVYPDEFCYGVELKTASPMLKLDEPKDKHVLQSELQLELWHRCTKYRPEEVRLLYFVSDDYSRMHEFIIDRRKSVWEQAKTRAKAIFDCDEPEDLLAEGAFVGECDTCDFSDTCRGARLKKIPTELNEPLPDDIIEQLEPLAERRVELKKVVKAEEAELKELDEQIKNLMSEAGSKRGLVGAFKVSIALVAGRVTYDVDSMRDDGYPVEEYSKKGNAHSRLTISKPNSRRR